MPRTHYWWVIVDASQTRIPGYGIFLYRRDASRRIRRDQLSAVPAKCDACGRVLEGARP